MKRKSLIDTIFPLKDHLYILQLEEYKSVRFLRWFLRHPFHRNLERKKRLVWTNKATFLFLASLLFMSAICYLLFTFSPAAIFAFPLIFALSPLFLMTSLILLKPYEVINKKLTIRRVRRHLATHPKLVVIGITGSFGKTSVKEILRQMLSKKYKVLATPQSYNTVFGIAKIVFEDLKSNHRIFIVELGAYQRGEIKALCQMVKPQIGVLTGVNEQHLERFRSIENTVAAKTELLEALPPDGLAVINKDNRFADEIINRIKTKAATYAVEREANIRATEMHVTEEGSRFKLAFDKGEGEDITTPLLGWHNVSNILAATAVALELGIGLNEISETVEKLSPPPHRLELIDPGSGVLIIDDSYSANPDGFKTALEVLKGFKDRRRVIVTPGIVELGKREEEIHEELGKAIGKTCNLVILVGRSLRTEALKKGLKETKFLEERLIVAEDLEEAKEKLKTITQPGDLILFENDLPDQYI